MPNQDPGREIESRDARPESLLHPEVVADLLGVIDLKDGFAVHAVAGRRREYRPVDDSGDPAILAQHYRSLGLRRLYIADLDGICRGQVQSKLLRQLLNDADQWDEILLDLGCGQAALEDMLPIVKYLDQVAACYRIIVATESAQNVDNLQHFATAVLPTRVLIGLDYRDGVFVSDSGDERVWLNAASRIGIAGAVVLDVASVGTGNSQLAAARCKKIRSIDAAITIYSGGGIKSADDIETLRNCGCERFLVATALHGL